MLDHAPRPTLSPANRGAAEEQGKHRVCTATVPFVFKQSLVLLFVVLAVWYAAPATAAPGRSATHSWEFGRSDDVNYDAFPDDWNLHVGPGYPAYQEATIAPHDPGALEVAEQVDRRVALWLRSLRDNPVLREYTPAIAPVTAEELVDRYLHIDLNGGGSRLRCIPFSVDWSFSYRVSVRMACQGLDNGHAHTELVFLDAGGKILETHRSETITRASGWSDYAIGPVSPPGDAVEGYVQLSVEPTIRGDIGGWVGFDSVNVRELPQLTLSCDVPAGLYKTGDEIIVGCRLRGVHVREAVVKLSLIDAMGEELTRHHLPIQLARRDENGAVNRTAKGLSGSAEWIVPVEQPGYYRIAATLEEPARTGLESTMSVAVIEPLPSSGSRFGWTVPHAFPGLSLREFPQLLTDCYVGSVKMPVWIDVQDRRTADDIAWTMERLQGRGVRCIGMLDQPPSSIRGMYPGSGDLPASVTFRDPMLWQPTLEPIMPRFNMRTVWWQLGGERDFSFTRQPDLTEKMDDLRRRIQGFGQAISVAISWPIEEPAETRPGGWQAECLSSTKQLSPAELDAKLEQRGGSGRKTWILLDPLAADQHSLIDRVRDLVMRMAIVRRHDVEAAFVSRPFDPQRGLFSPNGLPGEMLLPWRTTAAMIGKLRHEGQLELPNRSSNVLLAGENEAVMIVWSDEPTTEVLFLGDDIKQYDVWGRSHPIEIDHSGGHPRHIVPVGRMPTFLVGVDPNIARWRRSVQLRPRRLDSFLGKRQAIDLHFDSPLKVGINGTAQMRLPATWQTDQLSFPFDAEAAAEVDVPVDITLRNDATTGPERIKINFEFTADKPYQFSVWRDLAVGPKDIAMKLFSRVDKDQRLVIRLEIQNNGTSQHRYDCLMFAPPRRRQRARVSIPAGEQYSHEFTWPNGRELLGTTITLRAQQIGGNRILNYQITASE